MHVNASRQPVDLVAERELGSQGSAPCSTSSCWQWVLSSSRWRLATVTPAIGFKGAAMLIDYSLAGLVTAGLLFYLTYALLRPERF
jgi:K+-transporting ATPase KdpF subunit